MKLKTFAAAAVALAVGAASTAAFAYPATATAPVNVRSGPSTGYSIIDSLRRGETVDVQRCTGSFCYVEKNGPNGWVSANYLARGGNDWDDDYYPYPPPRRPSPPPYWGNNWNNGWNNGYYNNRPGFSFCANGQNASFCLNR
jgi:hypothetical protein